MHMDARVRCTHPSPITFAPTEPTAPSPPLITNPHPHHFKNTGQRSATSLAVLQPFLPPDAAAAGTDPLSPSAFGAARGGGGVGRGGGGWGVQIVLATSDNCLLVRLWDVCGRFVRCVVALLLNPNPNPNTHPPTLITTPFLPPIPNTPHPT